MKEYTSLGLVEVPDFIGQELMILGKGDIALGICIATGLTNHLLSLCDTNEERDALVEKTLAAIETVKKLNQQN